MSKIVNLKSARKSRARAEKRKISDGNAVRFGRSKEKRARDTAMNDKARAHLDQHKLDKE